MVDLVAFLRTRSSLGALAFAALVSLALASPASAQLALQRTMDGRLECAPLKRCMGDLDCATRPGTSCLDVALPDGSSVPPGRFCVDPERTRFCCAAPIDCPVRDAIRSVCVNPPGMTIDIGLCVYGDEIALDFCGSAAGTLMRTAGEVLRDCFTPPLDVTTPLGTASFAEGDCDRDGRPNRGDVCPCNPTNTCERADAGPIEDDAGTVESDAGPPDVDAGAPDTDAGTADLGTVPTPFDASVARGPEFRGGGGCACHVTHGGRAAHARFAALSGALLLLLRARRRRAR
jgi:hypothetical protein